MHAAVRKWLGPATLHGRLVRDESDERAWAECIRMDMTYFRRLLLEVKVVANRGDDGGNESISSHGTSEAKLAAENAELRGIIRQMQRRIDEQDDELQMLRAQIASIRHDT